MAPEAQPTDAFAFSVASEAFSFGGRLHITMATFRVPYSPACNAHFPTSYIRGVPPPVPLGVPPPPGAPPAPRLGGSLVKSAPVAPALPSASMYATVASTARYSTRS